VAHPLSGARRLRLAQGLQRQARGGKT
jgi:hypothetical protein